MLIGELLREVRGRVDERIAIRHGGESWTYRELDDASSRVAAALRDAGVRPGDRVALFLPNGVELVLDEHPGVRLSGVVGVPDPRWGQSVAAFVMLREGGTPRPTLEELRRFVADRLAAYKVPERIEILEALPLNATGKVDRKALAARALETGPDRS